MNDRIKKLRKYLNLTQQEFAERIGMKRNSITLIEGGRNTSDQTIFAICREFNVNEKWLRTGEGDMLKADADDELKALAKKYDISYGEYVFLEKYFKTKKSVRMSFFEILSETFKTLQENNIPASAFPFPEYNQDESKEKNEINPSELSDEEFGRLVRQQLELEEKVEEKSEVSSSTA